MANKFAKRILNGGNVFNALIAVLTSAIVSLLFNGFHWALLLSCVLAVITIWRIIVIYDICSVFKRMESKIRWDNKQYSTEEQIYDAALEFTMNDLRVFQLGKEKQPQFDSFEKRIIGKSCFIGFLIIATVASSCYGFYSIRKKTEKDRIDAFSEASKEYWEKAGKTIDSLSTQLSMNQDSLTYLIREVESDVKDEIRDLDKQIKGISRKIERGGTN